MEHVVFYPAASGVPAFRRVSSLDEAVNFVEHLRNIENISDFSVHELSPVQLSFRAYYHAHVPGGAPSDASEPEVAAQPAALAAATVESEPVAEASAPILEVVADVAEEPVIEAPVAEVAEAPAPEAAPVSEASDPAGSDEVTKAPVEATDDDRSAQWVAEAAVVERPVVDAPAEALPAVPGLAAAEPVVSIVPPFADPVAEDEVVAAEPAVAEAPVQRTPFADAPPVIAPVADADAAGGDAEPGAESASGDVVPALAPTGRRSLGFFAR